MVSSQLNAQGDGISAMKDKKKRARDTGLAIVLMMIIWAHFAGDIRIAIPAAVILILSLTVPMLFAPLAPLWFGFSEIMGALTSRIILTVLFFSILTPIALLRRLMGADPLSLKLWKCGNGSAFVDRQKKFKPRHLEKPF